MDISDNTTITAVNKMDAVATTKPVNVDNNTTDNITVDTTPKITNSADTSDSINTTANNNTLDETSNLTATAINGNAATTADNTNLVIDVKPNTTDATLNATNGIVSTDNGITDAASDSKIEVGTTEIVDTTSTTVSEGATKTSSAKIADNTIETTDNIIVTTDNTNVATDTTIVTTEDTIERTGNAIVATGNTIAANDSTIVASTVIPGNTDNITNLNFISDNTAKQDIKTDSELTAKAENTAVNTQITAVNAEITTVNDEVTVTSDVITNNTNTTTSYYKLDQGYQLPEFVNIALADIAAKEHFSDYKINFEKGSNHGDGFVADIVKTTIAGKRLTEGDYEDDKLVLIVKLPPLQEARRQVFAMRTFEREVYVYNVILPTFMQFQKDKGIKPENGFYSFPKCYFAYYNQEKDESAIIMEDVRSQGFKMLNKTLPVPYEHAKTVMQKLGQFHAISLAMKDQCPEIFAPFKEISDILTAGYEIDFMKPLLAANVQKAIGTLDASEQKIKDKVIAFADNIIEVTNKCTNGELSEPYSVINHGDCWTNNMMFMYESGIPKYINLYDWQVARYSSPILDIVYYIFLCTDKAVRDKHFDHLIQAYYNAMHEQLEHFGSDPNQLFPFTALIRQLKIFGKFALGSVLFAIPMMCTDGADMPNLDEVMDKIVNKKIGENEMVFGVSEKIEKAYNIRMSGVLRDMSKKGYL